MCDQHLEITALGLKDENQKTSSNIGKIENT